MSLTSGEKLGPYEIVSPLGAGGMGEVYRARDTRLKREVAIKVLSRSVSADADRLRRFEQEALATAAKISPDGKWVAFADHENPSGDDQGSLAVISADGKGEERKLSSGWESLEGIVWSPTGNEVWFTCSNAGTAESPHAASLSGKVRTLANVPGGMWFQDMRGGAVLAITHRQSIGIRGVSGGKQERELGWFGWSVLRDISRDGHQILFEEESSGGGPFYTVFLRNTNGSPPVRIGDGNAFALSPDTKWAITKPARGGPLRLVPTGAGETRQLTHDNVSYSDAKWLPDGKHVLAAGIESGHGARDYLIDLGSGNSKPVTPEGIAGVAISPDGKSTVVMGSDQNWGIWPLDGGGMRPIPGLDSRYEVSGWTPDGASLYVFSSRPETPRKVYKVNASTGKMDFWKTFGGNTEAGMQGVEAPLFSSGNSAYAYMYYRVLSEAYVITGLK